MVIEEQSNKKSDEFITKESRRWNVSVLMNLHQDFKIERHIFIEQRCMFKRIQYFVGITLLFIDLVVECSTMVQDTWVQSQIASYQRLLKWNLIPPCLTLSNIRYVSKVKWSNPGKGAVPSPTPRCSSYWKGSLLVALGCGR